MREGNSIYVLSADTKNSAKNNCSQSPHLTSAGATSALKAMSLLLFPAVSGEGTVAIPIV